MAKRPLFCYLPENCCGLGTAGAVGWHGGAQLKSSLPAPAHQTLERTGNSMASILEPHWLVWACFSHTFSNSSSFGNVRSQSVREICLEIVTGHSVPLFNLQSHNKSFLLLRLPFGGVWPAQLKPPLQTPTEPLPQTPAGCRFSRVGDGVCVCVSDALLTVANLLM